MSASRRRAPGDGIIPAGTPASTPVYISFEIHDEMTPGVPGPLAGRNDVVL